MKKILLFFFVGLCSCTNEQNINEVSDNVIRSVEVNIDPIKGDDNSRAILDLTKREIYWQESDTIGIFPNKGGQVEFPVDDKSVGTTKAEFNGGGWGLKTGYTYSAYYPYNFYNRDAKSVSYSFEGQVQTGSNSVDHLRNYMLMVSKPSSVVNGGLTFSMGYVGHFLRITLTLPEAKTYTSLALYADSEIIPVKRSINIMESVVTEKELKCSNHLQIGLKNLTTTTANQQVIIWMAFPYMDKPGETMKAVVKDSEGYVYVGDITRNGATFELTNMERGGFVVMQSSPVLTDGFTGGIEDWVNDGNDYGGVAQ